MKPLAFLLLLLILLSCISCQSEGTKATKADPDPATMVAIISLRDILTKCDVGMKLISEIQSKYSERRIQLGLLEQDIRKLQEDVKDPQAKGQKAALLQEKLKTIADEERKLVQAVTQDEAVQFKPLLELVNKLLEEYAKEKNISAVQERGAFVYFNRALDITDEIIKRVNLAK